MHRYFSFLLSGIMVLSVPSLLADPTPTPAPSLIVKESVPQATPQATPQAKPKSKPKQQGGVVTPEVLKDAKTQPLAIHVCLGSQRVYLLVGGKVAVDSPISSGKRTGWTPKGEFTILEKDPNHQSNVYGAFIDAHGKTIKSSVCTRTDAVPGGGSFRGAPMKYFMRLTPEGVGMHAGILPGYPASHGCIRLPLDMAKIIYTTVVVSTPVSITD